MGARKVAVSLLVVGIFWSALVLGRANVPAGAQMTEAATKLLDGLPEELRTKATFAYDGPERIDWHFIPRPRKGAVLKGMTDAQKDLVKALLRTGTSKAGYDKALAIMTLEAILREIENTEKARQIRDPELYYVSVFGKPSLEGKWGWRIEGHHLSINYTIDQGKVTAMTPFFFGCNPAKVPSGPQKGLRTLPTEEDLARELYTSLADEQRGKATIAEKAPADVLSGTQNAEPKRLPVEGLARADMNEKQKGLLDRILGLYAGRNPAEIAERLLAEAMADGGDKIRFGWAGPAGVGQPHYYRIQGPAFVVEFNNTQNEANHIHSLWRSYTADLKPAEK